MEALKDFWPLLALAVSGIILFNSFEKSMASKKTFWRILYFVVGVVSGLVLLESMLRILLGVSVDLDLMDKVTIVLVRIMQAGLAIIGCLIVVSLLISPKDEPSQ